MPIVQPFFHRQIVPVEDRIARRHAVQPADARAGGLQPGDDLRATRRLVQTGGQIRPHFAQVGRPPGQRAVERFRPFAGAHVTPSIGLRAPPFQPGHHIVLHRGGIAGGQEDRRALVQQAGHQRRHFQIQVHVARQPHPVQVRQRRHRRPGARHMTRRPAQFALEVLIHPLLL